MIKFPFPIEKSSVPVTSIVLKIAAHAIYVDVMTHTIIVWLFYNPRSIWKDGDPHLTPRS